MNMILVFAVKNVHFYVNLNNIYHKYSYDDILYNDDDDMPK